MFGTNELSLEEKIRLALQKRDKHVGTSPTSSHIVQPISNTNSVPPAEDVVSTVESETGILEVESQSDNDPNARSETHLAGGEASLVANQHTTSNELSTAGAVTDVKHDHIALINGSTDVDSIDDLKSFQRESEVHDTNQDGEKPFSGFDQVREDSENSNVSNGVQSLSNSNTRPRDIKSVHESSEPLLALGTSSTTNSKPVIQEQSKNEYSNNAERESELQREVETLREMIRTQQRAMQRLVVELNDTKSEVTSLKAQLVKTEQTVTTKLDNDYRVIIQTMAERFQRREALLQDEISAYRATQRENLSSVSSTKQQLKSVNHQELQQLKSAHRQEPHMTHETGFANRGREKPQIKVVDAFQKRQHRVPFKAQKSSATRQESPMTKSSEFTQDELESFVSSLSLNPTPSTKPRLGNQSPSTLKGKLSVQELDTPVKVKNRRGVNQTRQQQQQQKIENSYLDQFKRKLDV